MKKQYSLFIIFVYLFALNAISLRSQNSTLGKAPEGGGFSAGSDILGNIQQSVNLFNGQATFPVTLASVPSYGNLSLNVSLLYNSNGVIDQVDIWNNEAPTSSVGLGWSLNTSKIIVDNKQTGTRDDDDYYLVDGGSSNPMIRIGGTSTYDDFVLQNYQFWTIRFYPSDEKWVIKREDGSTAIYGDKFSGRNTIEHIVKWGNWIGSSAVTANQQNQGVAWNLSSIEDLWGQQIRYAYDLEENRVSNTPGTGLFATEASYLLYIEDDIGQRVDLVYGDKEPAEFVEPHTEKTEPDAYQERYEKRFLDEVIVKNEYGTIIQKVDLVSNVRTSWTYQKRLLDEIRVLASNNELLSTTKYEYNETGSYKGAIDKIVSNDGSEVAYSYSTYTIPNSNRQLNITAPNGYHEPKAYIGQDYVVVLWRQMQNNNPGGHEDDPRNVKLKLYQWNGKWEEISSVESTLTGVRQYNDVRAESFEFYPWTEFHVSLQRDHFSILYKDFSQNSYDLLAFHRNNTDNKTWYSNTLLTNTVFGERSVLLSGEDFIVAGDYNAHLTPNNHVFVWQGKAWRTNDLIQSSGNRSDYSAGANYFMEHSSDGLNIPLNEDDIIKFHFLNKRKEWVTSLIPNDIEVDTDHSEGIFKPEGSPYSSWHSAPSFAVVLADDNPGYIYDWNEDYTGWRRFGPIENLADNAYTQLTGNNMFLSANPLFYKRPSDVRLFDGLELTVSAFELGRYNGLEWKFFDNTLFPYVSTQFDITAGPSTAVASFTTEDSDAHGIAYFNPNIISGDPWSAQIINSIGGESYSWGTSEVSGNYALIRDDLYYRSANGQWNYVVDIPFPGSVENEWDIKFGYKDFIIQDETNGSRVLFLKNGTYFRSDFFSGVESDPEYNGIYEALGRSMIGPNILVLGQDNIQDTTSLKLVRLSDYKAYGSHTVDVVDRVTFNDQVQPLSYHLDYDLSKAVISSDSRTAEFGMVALDYCDPVTGTHGTHGSTEVYFANERTNSDMLIANGSNASNYPLVAKGTTFKTVVKDAGGNEISINETAFKVFEDPITNELGNQMEYRRYVRPVQQVSTVDGITNTVNYEYDESNGAVSSTTTTNYNSTNQAEDIVSHNVYGKDKYGSSWPDQLLTPVVESYTTVNGVEVSRTATTWQDWGSGQWAPLKSYEAKASNAGNFPFTGSPDLNKWQKLSEVIKRDTYGNPTETKDIEGIHSTVVMGFDGQVALGSVSNAEASEVLIENFDDGSFDDIDPYIWSSTGSWVVNNEGHLSRSSTSYRYIGTTNYFRSNNYVAEFDVKFDPGQFSGYSLYFQFNKSDYNSGISTPGHYLRLKPSGPDNLQLQLKGSSTQYFTKDYSFNPDWNHIRVVRDGSQVKIYLNHEQIFDEVVSGLQATNNYFNFYAKGIACQIDNLRIYPSDAYASSSTYDKDYGYVKEQIGESGLKTKFLYNAIQQQVATINTEGLVSETSMGYNSAEFNNGEYDPTDPHISHQTTVRGEEGFYSDFSYDKGNWITTNGSSATTEWIPENGQLKMTSSGGSGSSFDTRVLTLPKTIESERIGIELDVRTDLPNTTNSFGIGIGSSDWDGYTAASSAAWTYLNHNRRFRTCCNTVQYSSQIEVGRTYRLKITIDRENNKVAYFLNGKQFDEYTTLNNSSENIEKIVLLNYTKNENASWTIDNLTIYTNPIQSSTFHAAGGRTLQAQTEEADGLLISEPIYDELGRPHIQTVPTKVAVNTFEYRDTFVDSYNPTTGVLTGEVRTGNGHDYAYSRTRYDDSPLSRVLESSSPGASMQMNSNPNITADHTVEYAYGNFGDFVVEMNLPAGISLFPDRYAVSKTTDPDGFASYQVSDKAGRIVLSKTGDKITRNIYDHQGNLVEIHPPNYFDPPAGSTSSDWTVHMTYDYQGRLTTRTTNDAGTSRYYYDEIGRSKGMRDSRAWEGIYCTYTDYDELGRVTEEGYVYKEIDPLVNIGNVSGVTKTVVGGEVIGDGTISSDAWVVAQATNRIVLSDNFRAESGSRFRTETLPVDEGTKIWRKRFTYEDHSDNTFLRGALTKVEVNNDLEADVEVEESYTYNKYGELLEKGIKVVDYQNQTHSIGYDYDNVGNITKVDYGAGMEDVYYHHDIAGRLKSIGTAEDQDYFTAYDYDENGGLGTEYFDRRNITRTYSYHDEGWLQTMDDDYFTETLTYTSGGFGGDGSHTGTIASTAFNFNWSGAPTSYTYRYRYDDYGQLTEAQHTGDATQNVGVGTPITYDANGNIRTKRIGGEFNNYQYHPGTNKVKEIQDGSGASKGEYKYDQAGNVIASLPKGIGEIVYDQYFNLTKEIRINPSGDGQGGSDSLSFQYGSDDQRVLKTYKAGGTLQNCVMYVRGASDYPLIEKHRYEDGSEDLRYYIYGPGGLIATRESQIGPSTVSETATLEAEYRTAEEAAFGESLDQGALTLERLYDHTKDGIGDGYAQRLTGLNGSIAGIAKVIEVEPNDLIQVEVFAKYVDIPISAANSDVGTQLGANVAQAFGIPAAGEGSEIYTDLVDLVNAGALVGGDNDDSKPEGYLNYILFDENNTFVQAGFAGITENAREDGITCPGPDGCPHERLNLNISIEQTGYLYVYVSNESAKASEVYFDDMTITQTSFTGWRYILKDHLGSSRVVVNQRNEELPDEPGAVADSYSFRPFGERITSPDENEPLLAYQYTGQEYDKEAGLHNYRARFYDSELGRFYGVDPAGQFASPYTGMGNNPVIMVDPDGELAFLAVAAIAAVVGGGVNAALNAGSINSASDFFGYFGAGAAATTVGLLTGNPIAAGAVLGAGNGLASGGGLEGALIGGVTGGVAAGVGVALGPIAQQAVSKIVSPVLSGGLSLAIQGAGAGFAGGFTGTLLSGGSIGESLRTGAIAGGIGAGAGFVLGGAIGGYNAHRAGFNPFNGKRVSGQIETTSIASKGSTIASGVNNPKTQNITAPRAVDNSVDILGRGSRIQRGDLAGQVNTSKILNTSPRKLQAKFKHASDFGVQGNFNRSNATQFNSAINQHINSPGVQAIQGTYRGQPVIHFVNPQTGLNVISTTSGQFISGWRLNSLQLTNVLNRGAL